MIFYTKFFILCVPFQTNTTFFWSCRMPKSNEWKSMKLNEFRNKCSLTKRKFAAVFSSFTSYIVRKLHQYSPYFCIDYFIIFICFTPPALSPPTQKQKQRKKCVRLKLTETIQNQSFFCVIFFNLKMELLVFTISNIWFQWIECFFLLLLAKHKTRSKQTHREGWGGVEYCLKWIAWNVFSSATKIWCNTQPDTSISIRQKKLCYLMIFFSCRVTQQQYQQN